MTDTQARKLIKQYEIPFPIPLSWAFSNNPKIQKRY